MAEFEEKLNAILGDPEAMGQIVSIAKALTGETASSGTSPAQEPAGEAASPPEEAASSPPPDLSPLLGLLGGSDGDANPLSVLGDLDPRLIQLGMRLISEYNSPADDKTALLAALRPFVKEERFAKVDRAIQAARLARVVRAALRMFRESKEGGEGEHV